MIHDHFHCENCNWAGELDLHGRCAKCGSEAVKSMHKVPIPVPPLTDRQSPDILTGIDRHWLDEEAEAETKESTTHGQDEIRIVPCEVEVQGDAYQTCEIPGLAVALPRDWADDRSRSGAGASAPADDDIDDRPSPRVLPWRVGNVVRRPQRG